MDSSPPDAGRGPQPPTTEVGPDTGTIFTRAIQFFLVPLGIVAACVLVYLGVRFLVGGGPRNTKDIVNDLRDGGPTARAQAALELAEVLRSKPDAVKRDPTLVPRLIATYESLPAERPPMGVLEAGAPINIKILIIQCLGLVADPLAIPLLIKEAKTGPEELKPYCINALGGCKDTSVVPDLIQMLDSPTGVIRKFATNALGMLRDRRAVGPLRGKLGDPIPDVQWNAACVLAFYYQDPAGVPVLRRMLDRAHLEQSVGRDGHARELVMQAMVTALNAVAALGDAGFAEQVKRIGTDDPESDVRYAAAAALEKLKK